jgi:hypothetical protein
VTTRVTLLEETAYVAGKGIAQIQYGNGSTAYKAPYEKDMKQPETAASDFVR